MIKRTRILGTKSVVYSVWEPSSFFGPHGTLTTINGETFGRLGTRRDLPEELESLPPYSDERWYRVKAWYTDQYEKAYQLILTEYPHLSTGYKDMGEIIVNE